MSIAEKLVTIAENEPKVFEAGKKALIQNIQPVVIDTSIFQDELQTIAENTIRVYETGRQSAEKLLCTVSGRAISVNDVSPIEHSFGVKVESKNLFDNNKLAEWGMNFDGEKYTGSVGSFNGKIWLSDNFKENTAYTISLKGCNESVSGTTLLLGVRFTDETYLTVIRIMGTEETLYTYTSPTNKTIKSIDTTFYNADNVNIFYAQIEEGSVVTEYTPYIIDFSGVSVSRYGKNLFNLSNRELGKLGAFANTTVRNFKENQYYFKLLSGNYYIADSSFEILNSNSIKINTTNGYGFGVNFKVLPNQTYTVSFTKSSNECHARFAFYTEDGTFISDYSDSNTATTPSDCAWMVVCFIGLMEPSVTKELTFSNIQLELGSTATEYEPYKEPQTATANADGTVEGLTSLSPNMTLLSSSNEVTISMEYFRDVDLALENQMIEIAMSGGE